MPDFLFWCEQKLCGKIQMTCLGTLTDESEIEKIRRKVGLCINANYNSQ